MSQGAPSRAEVSPLDAVRRALLPPLRFAAEDDFARVDRLKGFSRLVERAVSEHGAALPRPLVATLRRLGQGFDEAGADERRTRARALLDALTRDPESRPARRKPKPEPAPPPVDPDAPDTLDLPVTALRGIGPHRAAALEARGLKTLADVLAVLPRGYEDRRAAASLAALKPGTHAVATGEVVAAGAIGRGPRARYEVLLDDGRGRLKLVFFHYRLFEMKRRFVRGATVTVYGEVQRRGGTLQMVHPRAVAGSRAKAMEGIWPVYPEVGGLHPSELARAARAALEALRARPPRELLPAWVREAARLVSVTEAYESLHAPRGDATKEELAALVERSAPGFYRLAFEELFVLALAMSLRRRAGLVDPALPLPGDDVPALWDALFPFEPTAAQRRAAGEVLADLDKPVPMGRLLQGDVGAGKTAVAAVACLRAVRAGAQAAVMVPTEILAEQHKATLQRAMRPLGVRVELVSGTLRGKARRLLAARLKAGEIDVAVGTHALLSDDILFSRLGLCVIDEQHRFGVVQRAALKAKGPEVDGTRLSPHLLVMTATPIPRSLALTLYGDLAVSVLDELPPGRTPVKTRVLSSRDEEAPARAVARALERGERAYVVYPLIEESEKMDLADATRGYERMVERFGNDRVALLHGRMPSEEREEKMRAFARGEVSVLVSTTVIEVGVDVPEATCMVVMHAERFGLSQLHQLRGRVGRGRGKSECVLVVGADAGLSAKRRLEIMEQTHDGFRIAEEDLAIRGPGDFLGTRQSGLPALSFADLGRHAELCALARRLADELFEGDPTLERPEHRDLRVLVERRFADRIALTAAG